jgi:hypothetical protein
VTIVPVRAATADLTKMALTDLEVASTAPVAAGLVIWTARPRTDPAVDNQANASRAFKAAALIAPVAVEVEVAPVATASVAAGDLAAVALAALVVEDSAGLAVAGDDEN